MGLEATTLAYIGMALAAAGSGAQAYTARETAKDQDAAAAQGIKRQQSKQREIDSRVNESLDTLERSTPDEERTASLDQYMQQLRSARSNMEGSDVPVTAGRYGEDVANSKAAIGNYGDKVAGLLSRIRAASDQRLNEGYDIGRMGSDVSNTARNAAGQAFIDQLRMNGIRPNAWVTAAGDVAKGAGGAMVSSAGAMQQPLPGAPPSGAVDPWAGKVPQSDRRFS